MRIIPLTRGYNAIVDDSDYDRLAKWKWRAHANPYTVYAVRGKDGVAMHRVILELDDPLVLVDHRNHNGLDNRRSNIRPCTFSENMRNKRAGRNCKSRVRGVFYDTYNKNWVADIYLDGKRYYLGRFQSFEEAARARRIGEKRFHGSFALSA